MPIAEIGAAVTSLKASMDIAKAISGAADKLKDAETLLRVADLITALADARTKLVEVEEQSIKQEQDIKRLQTQLAFSKTLRFERPYYIHDAEDGSKNGPYCATCYDSDRKAIRLQLREPGDWHCRVCKQFFRDSDYVPPPPPQPRRNPYWR